MASKSVSSPLLVAYFLCACGDDGGDADANLDATFDAAPVDAGPFDAPPLDAGDAADARDSGPPMDAGDAGDDGGNDIPDGTIDSPLADLAIEVGGSVEFQATCVDSTSPLSHAWNFGGGAEDSDLEDPGAVVFDSVGSFDVVYVCSDATGLADPSPPTRHIEVRAPALIPLVGNVVSSDRTQLVFVDPDASTPAYVDPIAGGWPAHASIEFSFLVRYSPDGRYLAFIADIEVDGEDALYVVDVRAASGGAVRVSALPAGSSVLTYEWAPDSEAIAYHALETSGFTAWIADLSTGLSAVTSVLAHPRVRPPPIGGTSSSLPQWSRDSRKLVMRGRATGSTVPEAYVFDRDDAAGGARRLHPALTTEGVERVFVVASSAVFIGDLDGRFGRDIYAVDLDRPIPATPIRLTTMSASFGRGVDDSPGSLALSPSGDELLFAWRSDGFFRRLPPYLIDLSAGAGAAFAGAMMLDVPAPEDELVRDYVWSPTGNALTAWVRSVDGSDIAYVFQRASAGSSFGSYATRTALRGYPVRIQDVSWSPDGQRLAVRGDFSTQGVAEVLGLELAGGVPRILNAPMGVDGDVVASPRWLSATELVYLADQEVDGVEELYVVDVAAPGVATKLSPPVVASGGSIGFSTSRTVRLLSPTRIVAVGAWRTDGAFEPVLLDRASATSTPLLPMLAAGQRVSWLPEP